MNTNEYRLEPNAIDDSEIDLFKFLLILFQGKWIIIAVTTITSIFAVIYSLSLPNIFESKAILAPNDYSQNQSSLMQSYSNIASIAGLNLPSQASDSNSVKAREKIKSLSFFEDHIMPNIFLPELMAVKTWNSDLNKLIFDQNIFDENTKTWVRPYNYPQRLIPSGQESFKQFNKNFSISIDRQTGFVNISIKHQSPEISKKWVDLVIKEINYLYRLKDRTESEKTVDYINQKLSESSLTEINGILVRLLQQEMQRLLFIEANDFYVFEYIDAPRIMEQKTEPQRSLICILGAIIGIFLGAIIVLIRYIGFRDKKFIYET